MMENQRNRTLMEYERLDTFSRWQEQLGRHIFPYRVVSEIPHSFEMSAME